MATVKLPFRTIRQAIEVGLNALPTPVWVFKCGGETCFTADEEKSKLWARQGFAVLRTAKLDEIPGAYQLYNLELEFLEWLLDLYIAVIRPHHSHFTKT